jgi:L-alanine-DL-glutamate epimerase-like enolase superfamily enzyme
MAATIKHATAERLLYPLPGAVGGSGVTAVEVIAVDLEDADGVTGTGFSYGLKGGCEAMGAAARDLLDRFIVGQAPDAPMILWRTMAGALNRLGRGAYYLALTAVDLAVWDLHAKQRGVTLAEAMGGRPRAVPVYGSGGYRPNQAPEEAAAQAIEHAGQGFPMVKLRLAGDRTDLARMEAVRDALHEDIDIAVDTNEKCDLNRALWLAQACADYEILWLEEPLTATDYAGHAALARTSPTPIATGEHLQGTIETMPLLRDQSCAIIQPDLAAMGGISECLRVAWQAEHFGVTCAPHFLPALFVHMAAAAPSVTWLEDFPLLEPLFDIDVEVDEHQRMAPGTRPGHGLVWADGARAEYRVAE